MFPLMILMVPSRYRTSTYVFPCPPMGRRRRYDTVPSSSIPPFSSGGLAPMSNRAAKILARPVRGRLVREDFLDLPSLPLDFRPSPDEAEGDAALFDSPPSTAFHWFRSMSAGSMVPPSNHTERRWEWSGSGRIYPRMVIMPLSGRVTESLDEPGLRLFVSEVRGSMVKAVIMVYVLKMLSPLFTSAFRALGRSSSFRRASSSLITSTLLNVPCIEQTKSFGLNMENDICPKVYSNSPRSFLPMHPGNDGRLSVSHVPSRAGPSASAGFVGGDDPSSPWYDRLNAGSSRASHPPSEYRAVSWSRASRKTGVVGSPPLRANSLRRSSFVSWSSCSSSVRPDMAASRGAVR
mmetsp:Transcript_53430/g.159878  ORF Transcript_53430/g.159878 Transcript_53430/m.159878 type:complete len:349 (-) Transcript_53430:532-1578(-)